MGDDYIIVLRCDEYDIWSFAWRKSEYDIGVLLGLLFRKDTCVFNSICLVYVV